MCVRVECVYLHLFFLANAIVGRNDAKAETPVLWPHHVKS